MASELLQAFEQFKEGVETKYANLRGEIAALNQKMLSQQMGGGGANKSLARELFENEQFKSFAATGRGRVAIQIPDFQTKTAITTGTLGSYTTGVIMPERLPGIVGVQQRQMTIRNLLPQIPTDAGYVDFVKVSSWTNAASPQAEASDKGESAMNFTSVSEKMRTVAHWIPVSRQALQDLPTLEQTINAHLLYGLALEEEQQLLAGDNTNENLNGLITQATAFDTSLLVAGDGWEFVDQLRRAIQQAEESDHIVDGIVLHPREWASIELSKDSDGRYICGDPKSNLPPSLWGRRVVITNSISQNTFLVGAFLSGAAIFDKMDATIEISDSHASYFIQNMLAIRCERRLALAVFRPDAFISGSFSQSPA